MSDVQNIHSDQIISAEDMRRVLQRLTPKGWEYALNELGRVEPALAAFCHSAAQSLVMILQRLGCPVDSDNEAQGHLLFSMVAVHVATRIAHRRLLDPFLPREEKKSVEAKLLEEPSGAKLAVFSPFVSNEDGMRWMELLLKEKPLDVAMNLADAEPAVVGIAVHLCNRTRDRLMLLGASPEVAEEAANKTLLAGTLCADLIRQGYAQRSAGVDEKTEGAHAK